MSRINSLGVADIRDEAVKLELASKYPARGRELPDSVRKDRPIPNFDGIVGTVAIMITFSTRKQNRNYQLGACNLLTINFNVVLMTFIFEFKISQIRNYMFI